MVRIMIRVMAFLLAALLVGGLGVAPAAYAEPDPTNDVRDPKYNEDEYLAFYTPPEPLPPGVPGDLIRTEPSRLVLEPSGQLGAIVATGTRIMYRSIDARGKPMAVTGTYFEPDNDWPGQGPRPLIVYGPGTQGQGDQCAPSRQFNQGIHFSPYLDIAFNYEELFVATMVARGFAIVMTDYQGLGTPGLHTYVNRVAQGNAMIDAGRAAMRLPDTSLDPQGPVAFWGYSQGGGAAASAAELAPSYAPDLHVVGTYAGAPPADLKELFPYADGSALVGVVGYALNSVMTSYPEFADVIRSKMTPRGLDMLNKVQDQCIAETLAKFTFRHLQPYFNVDIQATVEEEPFKSLFDVQKLGRFRPSAPSLILSNRFDSLVPWTAANQLGRDWCAQGADVQFWTNEQPPFLNKAAVNHALPMLVDGERAMQWIADRFNGLPTTPNCGEF
ncbi:lipase family protein [Mycolicibacterium sediminis]|uniref:Secretory lipase family protein n=2 Tax=Mycolicibacterium sediminis TaxID=1286180 RepID=A0A7I7QQU6_9MYCO|nr:secretory lipase family protein [Mycolicibacterium sediminis]